MTHAPPDSFAPDAGAQTMAPVRGAPWSNEAEQAVLGAMLLDQDAALRGAELLDDSLFYREGHRRLFRAMRRLIERRVVIDHVTLRDELERKGELEAAGGEVYLAELIDAAVTAANLEAHAAIVREKAVLRNLIEASTAIVSRAYEGSLAASELLDEAESRIFQISQYRKAEGFSRLKEMLWPTMERIERLHHEGKQVTGVPSGFKDLDEITTGFQPSDLVIVAARPSMGKTAFCLNIAAHAAETGHGVAIFSLEMSKESLVQRLLCAEARVDSQRVRRGSLSDTDFTMLARAAGVLSSCPIWIDDTPALTLLEMRSKARRLRLENEVKLVVLDYLQLTRKTGFRKSRTSPVRSRPWPGSSRFRSSPCPSCRVRPNSEAASASRFCRTCATRAPSNKTPMSSCSSIAPRCTSRWTRKATATKARPSSSSPSTGTARPATSISTSTSISRASRA
jgi:replicative DNA helicase